MYELWQLVENQPLLLLEKSEKLDTIYELFLEKRKTVPCVVTLENGNIVEIFESPDGGKTVYSRRLGDEPKNKKLIKTSNKKNQSKTKVGFTCGAFDLLHAGHALMLEEAKLQCDYLIVGVQSDPSLDRSYKNKPVQFYEERLAMVRAIKYVDEVVLYDTEEDLVNLLKMIQPDIRIIGADWKGKQFTGHDLPIECYFNSREHNWSTSNLRKRIYEAEKMILDWNEARK